MYLPAQLEKIERKLDRYILYLAKGLSFPILRLMNTAKHFCHHKKIACLYCEHQKKEPQKLLSIAQKNRENFVWCLLLPIYFIGLGLLWGGIVILPEIYVFYIASHWSGRLINHLANILTRDQESEEWKFFQNLGAVMLRKASLKNFYQDYKLSGLEMVQQLFNTFLLLTVLGRLAQFGSYCIQGFFSWLITYCFAKQIADEMPILLHELEKKEYLPESSEFTITNAAWLVSFTYFKSVASHSAQNRYQALHNETRHALPKCEGL